jgi:hypothetical protein
MVKDNPCLVQLHRGTYHPTPIRSIPELWNNKVLMFTGDVVEDQVLQAVLMPPLLLAVMPRDMPVKKLAQQLLPFHSDDSLQLLPPVVADVADNLCDVI